MKIIKSERNLRAGTNLRKIREIMNLNQAELARLAVLAPSQISNFETGAKGIGPKICLKLAKVFGVPPEELQRMLQSDGNEERLRLSLEIHRNDIRELAGPFLEMIELKKMASTNKLSQDAWDHLIRQIKMLLRLSKKTV
jgi:transcriptional regulator with XRE-family HTH domain